MNNSYHIVISRACREELERLRPPGQSWDKFLASMLPAIRRACIEQAVERARELALPGNLLRKENKK